MGDVQRMLQAPCFDTDKRNREKIEPWVGRLRASRKGNAHAFQPVKASSNQDMGEWGKESMSGRTAGGGIYTGVGKAKLLEILPAF